MSLNNNNLYIFASNKTKQKQQIKNKWVLSQYPQLFLVLF